MKPFASNEAIHRKHSWEGVAEMVMWKTATFVPCSHQMTEFPVIVGQNEPGVQIAWKREPGA
jgi:hypothetical protein